MQVAFDTPVLVYAEGVGDAERCAAARALAVRLLRADVILPVQVLAELFRVLAGEYRVPPAQVKQIVERWSDTHATQKSTLAALTAAFEWSADPGLSIWDSLIMAVAAGSGCAMLLSEDLQHGFQWRGVAVVNPLKDAAHPLLAAALA